MKKLVGIVLVAVMLAVCAIGCAEVDLQTIVAANVIYVAADVCPAMVQRVTYYDLDTGEIANAYDVFVMNDPDRGVTYTILYANGDIECYGQGEGYGYLAGRQLFYVCGFVGTAYEEQMLFLGEQNLGEFADGQRIVAQETAADGKLLVTTEGALTEEDGPGGAASIGQTLVVHYVLDPETLIMESAEACIRGEDGVEKPYLSTVVERDAVLTISVDLSPLTEPAAMRELHVIKDPGTGEEFDYVLEAPLNIPISLFPPQGYSFFDDAACTIPMTGVEADENGNYPESSVTYCGPNAQ